MIGRRGQRPAPTSVPLHRPPEWVEPAELDPPWWQRGLSAFGLAVLLVVLGIALAMSIGLILLAGFFLIDYLIS